MSSSYKQQKIVIDIKKHNFIILDQNSYFIHEVNPGCYVLIRSKCPHRGGPLHLGILVKENDQCFISCPWHDNKFNIKSLIAKQYPLTTKKNKVVLELKTENNVNRIELIKKNILI